MNTLLDLVRARTPSHRRRASLPLRAAVVERLEERLVLDAGGALSQGIAPPALFASQAELNQSLIDAAVARWKLILGTTTNAPPFIPLPPGVVVPFPVGQGQASPGANVAFSQTNDQVAGVDEADRVKTDGQYLYILSSGELDIVDVRNPQAMTVVSRTPEQNPAIAEYLNGTRLTVIAGVSASGMILYPEELSGARGVTLPAPGGSYQLFPAQTVITEYDVSKPATPQVVRQTTLDGSYVNSREIGDQVYVVLQNQLPVLPAPEFTHTGNTYTFETEAAYRTRLASLLSTFTLPEFTSTVNGPGGSKQASGPLLTAHSIYKPESSDDSSLFTIAVFDAKRTDPGPASAVGLIDSFGPTVYANQDHLYLATNQWPFVPVDGPGTTIATIPSTSLRKFSLQGDTVTMTAAGVVPGLILDPYSLDEQGNDLRIATTMTTSFGGPAQSTTNLFVLEEKDGLLNPVGAIHNLAPGEHITSVRFMGDRAFVVTFQQVDPLFTVDLTDPKQPKVAGSIVLPGFSRFLQPIDATHLVGIGRSVDPVTNRTTGLKLTLFDVSDLAHPRVVDTTSVAPAGWTWTNSDAEFDPHALSYFADAQVLALPILGYKPVPSGTATYAPLASQLEVFKVDPSKGFTLLGSVPHDSEVTRSVEIGNVLFSVAQNDVKANKLLDPATQLGQVILYTPPSNQAGGGTGGGSGAGLGQAPGGGPTTSSAPVITPPAKVPGHNITSLINLFASKRHSKLHHGSRLASAGHHPGHTHHGAGVHHHSLVGKSSLARLANRHLP